MTTVDVELARSIDGPDLVAALEQMGIEGTVEDGGSHVLARIADESAFALALEAWIHARGLPLVPLRLDHGCYAVTTPGS